jgi:hypothetical protein
MARPKTKRRFIAGLTSDQHKRPAPVAEVACKSCMHCVQQAAPTRWKRDGIVHEEPLRLYCMHTSFTSEFMKNVTQQIDNLLNRIENIGEKDIPIIRYPRAMMRIDVFIKKMKVVSHPKFKNRVVPDICPLLPVSTKAVKTPKPRQACGTATRRNREPVFRNTTLLARVETPHITEVHQLGEVRLEGTFPQQTSGAEISLPGGSALTVPSADGREPIIEDGCIVGWRERP